LNQISIFCLCHKILLPYLFVDSIVYFEDLTVNDKKEELIEYKKIYVVGFLKDNKWLPVAKVVIKTL
jgi:hypothetical protein